MKVFTVCGNGIGSSIMLKMKLDEICEEHGIKADIESTDFNSAQGKECDLIVTVEELANQFENKRVAVVRSYINKKKIKEDVLDILLELSQKND
ncbi:PTS sugar transporter subunit IIB [Tepidimicrobium xylanilyticum]|uniref:PTS system, ascorbate-specific IIB component n=1 Tax=Tepidimicrobium xylanilyticum TaxID=1123352 RepID=A0A1H2W833_9FIRM|nr:PTS sugar transporter subunit IIB [Tepidimicrobium xylanilyticum]GMG95312.1 PTS maltose transporter subunit IIBC [Tepidimicrobium xylanilyticum]SDW76717.1 PTS system, ascorbate-specific IIB component [Tepidimicrobium xylanilyticum]